MIKKTMFRLIAEEGKVLTNGAARGNVIDVLAEKENEWYEIDAPTEEEISDESI